MVVRIWTPQGRIVLRHSDGRSRTDQIPTFCHADQPPHEIYTGLSDPTKVKIDQAILVDQDRAVELMIMAWYKFVVL